MESAIEALLITAGQGDLRVMTYAECESAYSNKQSRVFEELKGILFLFEGFHPRTRPVLWRMLVTQACLYRVLSQPSERTRHPLLIQDVYMPKHERPAFDWRSDVDASIPESEVSQPFTIAEKYLNEKLRPRLERFAGTT